MEKGKRGKKKRGKQPLLTRMDKKMKKYLTIQTLIYFLISCLSSDLSAFENNDINLSLVIHKTKHDIKLGDPIPVVFKIQNMDEKPYYIEDRNYDRSGRMGEYKLIALYEDGTAVPDPREDYKPLIFGGLTSGNKELKKGEHFEKTIELNRWALITKAGRYIITGTYFPSNSKSIKSEPIEIFIEPRTDNEMADYINELVEELNAQKLTDKKDFKIQQKNRQILKSRESIVKKLAYTCDSRIVPTLITLIYENDKLNNEQFWVGEAFYFYLPHDPKILSLLIKAAKGRGLAPDMAFLLEEFECSEKQFKKIITQSLKSNDPEILSGAILAAQRHPDDSFMHRLISIATKSNKTKPNQLSYKEEKVLAIHALAYNRTDKGVKVLKDILNKPSLYRKTTKKALREAYIRHPHYPEYTDIKYTSQLTAVVEKLKDFRRNTFLYEIARTRTPEGVEVIKRLLADPNTNSPLSEVDEGVKLFKNLLTDPNEETRKMTFNVIQNVYKKYPGRPLRLDDFPNEFREDPDERKKKYQERIQFIMKE